MFHKTWSKIGRELAGARERERRGELTARDRRRFMIGDDGPVNMWGPGGWRKPVEGKMGRIGG